MNYVVLEKTARLFYRTVFNQIIERSAKVLREEQITQVQLVCMRFIHYHLEPSVGDIAEGLGISNAASAKLIDRLVKKAYLLREEDPVDRRVLKIKLTATGKKISEAAIQIEREHFLKIVGRMEVEEQAAFQEGLTAFLKAALVTPEEIDAVCLKCGWNHTDECAGNLRYQQITGCKRERY